MTEQHRRDKGTLLLAFIVGLSVHGTFSALFNSAVHFSVFPVLALCLAVYCFHQRYLNQMLPEGSAVSYDLDMHSYSDGKYLFRVVSVSGSRIKLLFCRLYCDYRLVALPGDETAPCHRAG